jgi:S-adenosylmethionine:tRNA ribosyltransferase-isomerase
MKIPISEYNYNLPDERIAKYPLERRDESKLLVYKKGELSTSIFKLVDTFLPENGLLVFNETRVIQARINFKKSTGAEIEVFCLEPLDPADYYQAFQKKGTSVWKCLVGNLKKWKEGSISLEMNNGDGVIEIRAEKVANHGEWQEIRFIWKPENISFGDILEMAGQTPIPPYLNRESEPIDKTRYQTIYSLINGSVAAPTAGLHFTPQVFEKIEHKNIECFGLTLHVGAGTFRPVKENDASKHEMHTEHFFVKKSLLKKLLYYSGNITSVGTTSLRALESIYWIGVKLIEKHESPFFIDQWDVYNLPQGIDLTQSLQAIIGYCNANDIEELEASTKIMIVPGYTFKVVNRLITNFHQPQSTLLLLVAAFIGVDWKNVYQYALDNGFRFLSYGDSSILIPD